MDLVKDSDKFFNVQVSFKDESGFQNLINLYYSINMDKNKSCCDSTRKIIVEINQHGRPYRGIITAFKVSKTKVFQAVQYLSTHS